MTSKLFLLWILAKPKRAFVIFHPFILRRTAFCLSELITSLVKECLKSDIENDFAQCTKMHWW